MNTLQTTNDIQSPTNAAMIAATFNQDNAAAGSVPFIRPPSANEIKRTVPKNIKKDKEELWEENL